MRGDAFTPVPHRGMITISIMLANIMQGLDNTILNVALPHIQGSLSASLDQVAWALTSYIVCSAIMMPLTGWLAGRFGIKHIFLASIMSWCWGNGTSAIYWRITPPTTMGCARTLHLTRIRRSIDLRRQSGVSHQSLGSAVSIGTTFGRHNR